MGCGSSSVSDASTVQANQHRQAWADNLHDGGQKTGNPHDISLRRDIHGIKDKEYDNRDIYEDDLSKNSGTKVKDTSLHGISKHSKIEGDIILIDDLRGETPSSDELLKFTEEEKLEENDKLQGKLKAADVAKKKNSEQEINTKKAKKKQTEGNKVKIKKLTVSPSKNVSQKQKQIKPSNVKSNTPGNRSNQNTFKSSIPQPKWRHDYDIPAVNPTEGLMEGLPHIYEGLDRPIKIEDTFWSRKKKLIPDMEVMRKIDNHALKAPKNIKTDVSKLVNYLIKPASNDLQKYRAIVRWISDNIAYDVDVFFNRNTPLSSDPMEALKKGAAVCAGYSALFQLMCKEANLPCDVMRGKAKGYGYVAGTDKYESHAWNKITIEGQPFLCDTTWGSGGIGPDLKFSKRWKEHDFLSEPKAFTNTHLPVSHSGEIGHVDQILEKPFTTLKAWEDEPFEGFMMQLTDATLSSHHKGTITSPDNTGEIRIDIPRLVKLNVIVSKLPEKKVLTASHVLISWEGTTAVFRYELPGPGKYLFSVLAGFALPADKESDDVYGVLVSYCINGKGTQNHSPNLIPDGYSFGNSPQSYTLGYQCLSHSEPTIETTENRLLMQFACPTWGNVMYRLASYSSTSKDIKNCIYQDTYPGKRACYIFLPKPGKYLLEHLIVREPGTDQYHRNAAFLLVFKGKVPSITSPFAKHNDWGKRQIFEDYKLSIVDMAGYTIRLQNGNGLMTLQRPLTSRGVDILVNIVNMSDTAQKYKDWSIVTTDEGPLPGTELVHITINIPTAGFYCLNLFVDLQFAGRFPISSDGKK